MRNRTPVDVATLSDLLSYDPDTGRLFWKERNISMFPTHGRAGQTAYWKSWNSNNAGKEAMTATDSTGYKCGNIFQKKYYAHRIIWALQNGVWPESQIDHINGITSDNRLANLRSVTRFENQKNMKLSKRNTSGHVGVSWLHKDNVWIAQIYADGQRIHLGRFKTKDEAILRREAASEYFGFHGNHGAAR